ncbi:MAG: hypothetical protein HKN47_13950 [Pirellulaceae bacterium]|nr:hypothetical protein [Pirellulaceae bacterium]
MRLILCSFVIATCATTVIAQDNASEASASVTISSPTEPSVVDPYSEAAIKKWDKAISELETQDQAEADPDDAVLFIGSSSIRRWETMAQDMTPFRTIRRGYGGAKFTDMAVFVDRLVQPHRYRALVMFVGNGVTGTPDDHTPDQIEALARHIVATSHAHQVGVPVFLIEITPCEKRFAAWHKIRVVNARLREVALSTPDTYFIPTASHFLRPDGTPRGELFVDDKLHLNEAGYDLWSILIRARLTDVFRSMADTAGQESGDQTSPAAGSPTSGVIPAATNN